MLKIKDKTMTDYKDTLNLPNTDFPMKANLAEREPQILHKWHTSDIYQLLRSQGENRPKFILHDGPPYANAHIHMGTAINKTLKDIVVKAKTLSGFDAPYVPGWDCHGLPIELNVEKQEGKAGVKITAKEFRAKCRAYAESQVDIQREEFKRLGVIGDWDNPYLTMSFNYEAGVIRSLAKMIHNGHIEKGLKPVHWCVDCGSALAEAEVEYIDKTSPSIDVLFRVIDEAAFLKKLSMKEAGKGVISIPIWTTTPWTLPANQAVALNPLLEYVLMQTADERLLIAADLIESVMQRYGVEQYKPLGRAQGEVFAGILLAHPFYERQVPVVLGDHVTIEAGTGAVHTAPAHGQDDYEIGKKNKLAVDNPVGDNGCFLASTPLFAGEHVSKVNDHVIEVLKDHHALLHAGKMTHSYPHCWRHKTPLIFRATPQWFVNLEQKGLRAMALDAIKQVRWIPDSGQVRITSMVEGRPDWCISRQRSWGVPIALFIHKDTGEMHPRSVELLEQVAERVEQHGVDAWFDLPPNELLPANEVEHYKKCTDILDVWFDSGSSHQCVLEQRDELKFPADLYLEGSDQHRGWFQSSLLTSLAISKRAPFRTVLTHGYVIDVQGRKMSKSIGNVIAPEKIIKSLGADVLRLWAASVDYRNEINCSDEILSRISEAYRRIRNTARFLLANLNGFDPEKHLVPAEKMLALDRWAVETARLVQEEIIRDYDNFEFHTIYQTIHHFCTIEMGSFYLDVIKDRQYTMPKDSLGRRSAQTALYHIVEALTRWLAPILSFTAEEIWQYIPGEGSASVFLTTWYTDFPEMNEKEVMNPSYWEEIRKIRDAVNKELEVQRAAGHIGSALEAEVTLYCSPEIKQKLDLLGDELRFVLITSYAIVFPEDANTKELVATEIAGLWLKVTPVTYPKCARCWHRRQDIGSHADHPELCSRCIINIADGEVRRYA